MSQACTVTIFLAVISFLNSVYGQKSTNETLGWNFINEAGDVLSKKANEYALAAWEYNTNITDANRDAQTALSIAYSELEEQWAKNATEKFDWENFSNDTLKRLFSKLTDIGTAAMKNKTKLELLSKVKSDMSSIYGVGKVWKYDLEPGLTNVMATSRNYHELLWAWLGWRNVTGAKIKSLYKQFVELSNEAYRDAGYKDTKEAWLATYETPNFAEELETLWQQLKPLYKELHTYVRRNLKVQYGNLFFPKSGHIPAHILGNMWAQSWSNVYKLMTPFKHKQEVDVTPEMQKLKYDAKKMFEVSEEFFVSLGLEKMPELFWNNSMIEKPKDGREVICHASAWDFSDGKDFRIKQCTAITMDDLITVHHEMGHIAYFLHYKNQPYFFKGGANPGFHEAVGDLLALSVSTPKHLKQIGLLANVTDDREADINYLLNTALDKIAFLPFGYLMDLWRWKVFSGEVKPENYNSEWWKLRCKYQGIFPPVARGSKDFDPGAKFHIPGNTPYVRYFVSFIIQFQFHKYLCGIANQTGPLHKCDIYQNKEAGAKIREALELGSSKVWPEAMKILTGQDKMDARPLMEYFQPLIDWLREKNVGDTKGWDEENCPNVNEAGLVPEQTMPFNGNGADGHYTRPTGVSFFIGFFMCTLSVSKVWRMV